MSVWPQPIASGSPEQDCYLLTKRKVNVVDCTVSNLKLTSGIAPLNTLMKANVNVCLGTNGASSNNNLGNCVNPAPNFNLS